MQSIPALALHTLYSKVTWPGNRQWTDHEDVFPIENGGISDPAMLAVPECR